MIIQKFLLTLKYRNKDNNILKIRAMKSYRIIDEFGIDITKRVDVVVNADKVQVFDEIGVEITSIVDVVEE